jgi:hypothetical protein
MNKTALEVLIVLGLLCAMSACAQITPPGLEKYTGPFAVFRNDCPYAREEHKKDLAKNWNGFNYKWTLWAWAKNYSQYVPGLTAEKAKACFDPVETYKRPKLSWLEH